MNKEQKAQSLPDLEKKRDRLSKINGQRQSLYARIGKTGNTRFLESWENDLRLAKVKEIVLNSGERAKTQLQKTEAQLDILKQEESLKKAHQEALLQKAQEYLSDLAEKQSIFAEMKQYEKYLPSGLTQKRAMQLAELENQPTTDEDLRYGLELLKIRHEEEKERQKAEKPKKESAPATYTASEEQKPAVVVPITEKAELPEDQTRVAVQKPEEITEEELAGLPILRISESTRTVETEYDGKRKNAYIISDADWGVLLYLAKHQNEEGVPGEILSEISAVHGLKAGRNLAAQRIRKLREKLDELDDPKIFRRLTPIGIGKKAVYKLNAQVEFTEPSDEPVSQIPEKQGEENRISIEDTTGQAVLRQEAEEQVLPEKQTTDGHVEEVTEAPETQRVEIEIAVQEASVAQAPQAEEWQTEIKERKSRKGTVIPKPEKSPFTFPNGEVLDLTEKHRLTVEGLLSGSFDNPVFHDELASYVYEKEMNDPGITLQVAKHRLDQQLVAAKRNLGKAGLEWKNKTLEREHKFTEPAEYYVREKVSQVPVEGRGDEGLRADRKMSEKETSETSEAQVIEVEAGQTVPGQEAPETGKTEELEAEMTLPGSIVPGEEEVIHIPYVPEQDKENVRTQEETQVLDVVVSSLFDRLQRNQLLVIEYETLQRSLRDVPGRIHQRNDGTRYFKLYWREELKQKLESAYEKMKDEALIESLRERWTDSDRQVWSKIQILIDQWLHGIEEDFVSNMKGKINRTEINYFRDHPEKTEDGRRPIWLNLGKQYEQH